ncbi:SAM-dependent methyltransferase [Candidatus Heimdallarchaeota archaeon B3_Heim]|nr:MAG: SAM-dependent methyltransferase [Candidatus Heimdallarchaeota archaeon B3_Heim]
MKDYIEANRKRWNELADVHFKSEYYNVEKFREGGVSISGLEVKEVGDVNGKNLLHLQCHFGKDSLSWARLGAQVTGVDFSGKAIELATQLSKEVGINATFIQSEIENLDQSELPANSFDIVFTSHGAIYWLPELKKWAQQIVYYLKPGGFFYIAEGHPMAMIFDDENEDDFKVLYPYFHLAEPLEFDYDESYASGDVKIKNTKEYGWVHDLGYIVNNLIDAGLRIDFINEYPFVSWKMFPFLEEREGWWYLPEKYQKIPLTFTLKATKEEIK